MHLDGAFQCSLDDSLLYSRKSYPGRSSRYLSDSLCSKSEIWMIVIVSVIQYLNENGLNKRVLRIHILFCQVTCFFYFNLWFRNNERTEWKSPLVKEIWMFVCLLLNSCISRNHCFHVSSLALLSFSSIMRWLSWLFLFAIAIEAIPLSENKQEHAVFELIGRVFSKVGLSWQSYT